MKYSWYKFLLLSFSLVFFFFFDGSAQKEGNTWYFGLHAGINFNTSPPTALTDGQTNSREGVATLSDKHTGQLLFYTEGTTVWDANQQVMPHGSGLQGDYSSTQSAIIVPDPADPYQYYIFTTAGQKGFRYSEVDMRLHGGAGDVITATKNTLLIPENRSTEKIIATRHCNGKDFWVITHTLNDNRYYVYGVTEAGLSPPLIFAVGSVIHGGGGEITSYLKVSPDGNLLVNAFGNPAGASTSKVELLHFNNQSGVISGPAVSLDDLPYPYGVEFSPNGNLLYVSTQQDASIYQYDLGAADIGRSRILIHASSRLLYGALQLAPDGKIYVSAENGYNVGYGYLGVINYPDSLGPACDFVPDAFYLEGKKTLIGLPTFVGSFFYHPLNFRVSDSCLGSNTRFHIVNSRNIDSVKWDFGDQAYSTQINPVHEYKKAQKYQVQLIIYHPCTTDTAYKTITIHEGYSRVDRVAICEGETYRLPDGRDTGKAGAYVSTFHTVYGCDSTITTQLKVNPAYRDTIRDTLCRGQVYTLPDGKTADQAGNYRSNLHTLSGCDSIITTILSYRDAVQRPYSDTICEGDTLVLPDGQKVSGAGIYTATFPSATGGCDTLAVYHIYTQHLPVIDLGSDTCLPAGQQLVLNPGSGYPRYEWQNGSTDSTLSVSFPGTYQVKVFNTCGYAVDSIKVTMNCLPRIFIPSAFTPNGDGMNDTFRILNVHGQKLAGFSVFDRWGKRVFYTRDIGEGWNGKLKGKALATGAYVYLIQLTDVNGKLKIYKGTVTLLR